MKIGIVVIASNENLYLRDFVKYYESIGADKIILGDNSPVDGDFPQVVIGDYIEKGFVDYINLRGYNEKGWLTGYYNSAILQYKDQFDWLCVFDVDEYITFNSKVANLKEYLSLPEFANVCSIKINWRCFDDNDLLFYDGRSVMERFTRTTSPIDFKNYLNNYPENSSTKIIINCKNIINFCFMTPHVCLIEEKEGCIQCVDNAGHMCNARSGVLGEMNYDIAQLNHYRTLTISEFLYRRCAREIKKMMNPEDKPSKLDMVKMFAAENKLTLAKKKIIEDFFNKGAGKNYNKR